MTINYAKTLYTYSYVYSYVYVYAYAYPPELSAEAITDFSLKLVNITLKGKNAK